MPDREEKGKSTKKSEFTHDDYLAFVQEMNDFEAAVGSGIRYSPLLRKNPTLRETVDKEWPW